jgi:hypothetical protein
MVTKLVIRLLDANGLLLGWKAVMALARGDGQLWAQEPVRVPIELSGWVTQVSTHWADVNVESRVALPEPIAVQAGKATVDLGIGVLLVVGPMPGELPPVTVRDEIVVAPPIGSLAGVGAL